MRTDLNPLLNEGALPDFAAIEASHVSPALDALLQSAEAALAKACAADTPATYFALAAVLDEPVEHLTRAWGHVCHLQSVADTPLLRAAHAQNLPRVTEFFTKLTSSAQLFEKTLAIQADARSATSSQEVQLSATQRKAVDEAVRDFILGGAKLQGEQRERFAANQERQAELSQQFGEHVLDATDDFALYVDASRLSGVPPDVVQAAQAAALADGKAGAKLTLKMPCYWPAMQHATDRELRESLFRAYATRASELGDAQWDNTAIVQELLALRQEEAKLLSLDSYAHLSLATKMARSPQEVLSFIRGLAGKAKPFAQQEWAQLQAFAKDHLSLDEVQPWDRSFAAERMKEKLHAFSSEAVRAYFPLPRVLSGLFLLVQRLFGIQVREADVRASVWHNSVRFYEVWQGKGAAAQCIAGFYLDPYARAGKQGGAWMDNPRQRWRNPRGQLQRPLAHLVCNFAAPVGGKPALLSHDEVITLFHEFGHGLHHMLTQVEELSLSGIQGVEWDACELPSQFMENFCWEWAVVQPMSEHVDTGEPLPKELFDRMLAARNFHSALAMLRGCEYGLFDMSLHLQTKPVGSVMDLVQQVAAEVAVAPAAAFARYPHSFSHLFDGGYAAGYYGYAWAEVLSADAFAAFEETGLFDSATGERFACCVLQTGGSRSALENFVAFRGREPSQEALLRHQGLVEPGIAATAAR